MTEVISTRQKPQGLIQKIGFRLRLAVRYYWLRLRRLIRRGIFRPVKHFCRNCLAKAWKYRVGRWLIRRGRHWHKQLIAVANQHPKFSCYLKFSTISVVVIGLLLIGVYELGQPNYQLTLAEAKLIGLADSALLKSGKFAYDAKTKAYYLNKSDLNSSTNSFNQDAVSVGNTSAQASYGLKLPINLTQGVTIRDNNSGLSFSIEPQFNTDPGKNLDSHIVYPLTNNNGAEDVYTVKQNGLQEDVVLNQPTASVKLTYKLSLPDYLVARSLSDGAIGIYSADPALFGNITYGSSADQLAVAKARVNSQKDYLVFALLPPVIRTSQATSSPSSTTNPTGTQTSLTLKGNTITLIASNLSRLPTKAYPLDIDPSILVASANSFSATGNNEGDLTMGTSSINEAGLTGGTIGAWTATTTFTTTSMPARYGLSAVAYNGYLYVMGGQAGASTGDCTAIYCNGVFYAPINSNGTIGAWTPTTFFTTTSMPARYGLSAVAYNGYLYVMGGHAATATGDCTTGSDYCNGVFYAPINSNGSIGTWTATTTFTTTSMPARAQFAAVVYNGYLYVMGGAAATATGDCGTGSDLCNGTFYAPINSDGTIGAWTPTTFFTTTSMPARYSLQCRGLQRLPLCDGRACQCRYRRLYNWQ